MNSKYQPGEKININKIFFEDNFIDLINKLVKTISDYYHFSLGLISKSSNIYPLLESNISKIMSLKENNNNSFLNNNQELSKVLNNLNYIKKEYKLIINKTDENLKSFFDKANIIFKEMKEKKNNKIEEVMQDFARKNNLKIKDQNDNSNGENVEPFRLSYLSKESTSSKKSKKERNKTTNKIITYNKNNNNILHNFSMIKNLINKMGEYNNIISNYSYEARENYINLQKQLLFEINKVINNNTSKSVERKNIIKSNNIPTYNANANTNTNNNNNNPFIMLNNNNSNNITMTTTNNNSYYNIIDKENLKDFKSANSNRNSKLENYINNNKDLRNEINNLKSELDNLKNTNKNLENKIEESNKNIDIIKKNEKNKFIKYKNDLEIKMKSLEKQNNELKKEYGLLLQKYNIENGNKNGEGVVEKLKEKNFDEDNIEISKLKLDLENKKNEYELNIKKLNEEINNAKKENEQVIKKLNDKNTELSKCLAEKSREIQTLQNNNKLKTNELNKLKLIVKTNEKQLKVKKIKAERQKANSPNIKIRDLLANSRNIYDNNNDLNINSPNISANNDNNNNNNKEIISKLELEISQLKEELEKRNEEKESLASNISTLEKNINDKNKKNEILENELNNKNNEIEDENKLLNELKCDKEKLIQKLKEYKNIEELNLSQIKILKNHIKEIEKHQNIESDSNQNKKNNKKKELKKRINELEIEITNIKMKLDIEINNNEQLKNEIKYKTEQIDGLKTFIKKLEEEKESYTLKKSPSLPQNSNTSTPNNVNRSKTNGDIDFIKLNKNSNNELNIKNIIIDNDNILSNKDIILKKQNFLNKKEYKTDKKLETYNLNENISNKQNEATKSEDAKLEFSNNNNKNKS